MRYLLPAALVGLLVTQTEAKIMSKTIMYKAGETTLQGYLVYDDAIQGKRPGVLVFPEWWGVTDFPKKKADQLARMGYTALAADMFGDGRTTDDPKEAAKLVGQLSPEVLRQRAQAALQVLTQTDSIDMARLAAIGFCFGGKVALELAYSGAPLAAVVTFHADLVPPSTEQARQVKAQILVQTGADDPMVPPEKVLKFWQAMQQTGLIWQIDVYAGAKHSFTNPAADMYRTQHGLQGVAYNAIVADRSWSAMQKFFHEVFRRDTGSSLRPATSQR